VNWIAIPRYLEIRFWVVTLECGCQYATAALRPVIDGEPEYGCDIHSGWKRATRLCEVT